jgi:hypothetical protein
MATIYVEVQMGVILRIETDERFDLDVWELEHPDHVDVELSEPLAKGTVEFVECLTALVPQLVTITVILDNLKVTDWVLSKSYDAVFVYLKDVLSANGSKPMKASLEFMNDAGVTLGRAEFENLDPENLQMASYVMKSVIVEEDASGGKKTTTTTQTLRF